MSAWGHRVLVAIATAACSPLAVVAAKDGQIVITHARAVTMSSAGTIENATILIRDGRIAAIGANVGVPAAARVIDAQGRIVTPGLMDSATQLGLVEVSAADDTVDYRTAEKALGASFDVRYALNANSTLIPLARADGLTRAITFPSGSGAAPFTGMGAMLRLRPDEDLLERPRVALFAQVGGAAAAESRSSRSAQWSLIRNALDEAAYFKKHAKAFEAAPGRDQLSSRLDVQALQTVIDRRTPLAIFAARESDIRQVVQLADDYSLNVVLLGATEGWRVAELLAARKIPVVVNPFDNLPSSFDEIGARLDNAAILQHAGVLVAFHVGGVHASHNAGAALREGAGLAVANGMSWEDALRALTLNPARIWGIADRYGTLAPGRDADLVVWGGDPLEPMTAAERVVVQGQEVSLQTRQRELRDRYAPKQRENPLPPGYR